MVDPYEPSPLWDVPVPLQAQAGEGRTRCGVCIRRCSLGPGQTGFCGCRENRDGRLVATSWGRISASEPRPMEIKPFFHYHPGETALTFSSWGCNLDCDWCQNHHLSKHRAPDRALVQEPELLMAEAEAYGVTGVCVSFNEPATLFEYSLDLFPMARERGMFCCWVTNGLVTGEALRMLADAGLGGMTISVKGDEDVYRRHCALPGGEEALWSTIALAQELGIHTETVYLLVTDTNDSEELVDHVIQRHLDLAGPDSPIHFTRYHPAWKHDAPPTPVERVEAARHRAVELGARWAYTGNLPDSEWEHTHCPECGRVLMVRGRGRLLEDRLEEGDRCSCGHKVPLVRDR